MMHIHNILFDLDGTLSDPAEGIVNAIMHALDQLGIEEKSPAELTSFIGPPIVGSFRQRYRMNLEEANKAVAIYRKYYGSKGKFENQLYPGIPDLLHDMTGRGLKLYVATAKPEGFAREILEHFGIMGHFSGMVGATLDHSRSEKEDIIRLLLQHYRLEPARCLMVGDRMYDLEGARACGMKAIGVSYGHGSQRELELAAPLALARDVRELGQVLTQFTSAEGPSPGSYSRTV